MFSYQLMLCSLSADSVINMALYMVLISCIYYRKVSYCNLKSKPVTFTEVVMEKHLLSTHKSELNAVPGVIF
jgi:hypothetical protein